MLPVFQEKCSVISAKVTYNTSQEARDLDKLWLEICAKRDVCDRAMKNIKDTAFFFSSVAVVEKKVQENECEEGKDGDEEMANDNSQKKKNIYWPAISYWIALRSRDDLRMSTIPVHSALLDTGIRPQNSRFRTFSEGGKRRKRDPRCEAREPHTPAGCEARKPLSAFHTTNSF